MIKNANTRSAPGQPEPELPAEVEVVMLRSIQWTERGGRNLMRGTTVKLPRQTATEWWLRGFCELPQGYRPPRSELVEAGRRAFAALTAERMARGKSEQAWLAIPAKARELARLTALLEGNDGDFGGAA